MICLLFVEITKIKTKYTNKYTEAMCELKILPELKNDKEQEVVQVADRMPEADQGILSNKSTASSDTESTIVQNEIDGEISIMQINGTVNHQEMPSYESFLPNGTGSTVNQSEIDGGKALMRILKIKNDQGMPSRESFLHSQIGSTVIQSGIDGGRTPMQMHRNINHEHMPFSKVYPPSEIGSTVVQSEIDGRMTLMQMRKNINHKHIPFSKVYPPSEIGSTVAPSEIDEGKTLMQIRQNINHKELPSYVSFPPSEIGSTVVPSEIDGGKTLMQLLRNIPPFMQSNENYNQVNNNQISNWMNQASDQHTMQTNNLRDVEHDPTIISGSFVESEIDGGMTLMQKRKMKQKLIDDYRRVFPAGYEPDVPNVNQKK